MIMNISFEGKVALVTGAASGLGLATAKAFAESGASVVLADWNEREVQAAVKNLTDQGHKVSAIRCDVSDDAQVEAMVKQTVATFGRLDAAYNNAGIQNVLAETADSPRDGYDRVMSINLRSERSALKIRHTARTWVPPVSILRPGKARTSPVLFSWPWVAPSAMPDCGRSW
jgi:NAD(P)-dependent dehydrogenase (short-subunit alcohol dehydrogenase family)